VIASTLPLVCVLAGGVIGKLAPADKMHVSATLMGGTGLSLTGSDGRTYGRRSPAFLLAEVGLRHPDLMWLEFAPALLLEVEGRVGFGLLPRVRAFVPTKRVKPYGVLGLPIFVAPYSLLGIQAGFGFTIELHKRIALVAEFTGNVYVWGSDLMTDSVLGKLDQSFGVRVSF
jgi:hypothetical protein